MLSGQFNQRAFIKKFVSTLVIFALSSSFLFSGFPLGGELRLNLGAQKALAVDADHVVISEVQTGRTNATTSDFIELYNPTQSAINLKGFRLVRRAQSATADTTIKSWTTDTFIPANGFYLWANSSYSAIAVAPDTTTTATIADNNSIALRQSAENSGQIIDGLAWGSGHVASLGEGLPLKNILPDKSLERKASAFSTQTSMAAGGPDELKGNAWDTGDNSADFVLSTYPQPQNSLSPAENSLDTDNPNVVINSSFEDDNDLNGLSDYWAPYNLTSGDERSSEYSTEGGYSLKITGDAVKSKYVRQTIPVSGRAGDSLTLNGWNKTVGSSATGGAIAVIIHLSNYDGTRTIKMMYFGKNPHNWLKSTTNITANKDYSAIDIAVVYVKQKGTAYFDGLLLTRKS